jgi:outer membrane PBP1 activator LpoA protein
MKTVVLCLFVIVSSSFLWAADEFTPLDVKLGLWETTWTGQTQGQLPIPADAMANLTPEQRARIEEAMKARAAKGPMSGTNKSCITKDKLNKDAFAERKECTHSVVSSSSHKLVIKMECEEQNVKSNGTLTVEALTSGLTKGTMEMVATGGGHTMNINNSFTSKWISSDCGDVK